MVHQVEIFGQPYSLRADADSDHVRRVAELVDGKMREVAASARTVSTLQIAVLAAMDLASEFLLEQASSHEWAAEVEQRHACLAECIDNLIPEAFAATKTEFPCCARDSAGSC